MKSSSRTRKKKYVRDPNRPLRFNFFHTSYDVVLRVAAQSYADPEDVNPLPDALEREMIPYDSVDRKTDIAWIDRTPTYEFFQRKECWTKPRRISRFPQFRKLCTKNFLFRCLNRLRFFFPADYDFYPTTFILPSGRDSFMKHKGRKRSVWIAKPSCGHGGKGIVVQSIQAMKKSVVRGKTFESDCVIQEYIDRPFLLSGYKFDMRIFVLVTSLDPLEVYLFENGLVRQATEKYSYHNLHNHYIHLTNSSINKHNSKPYEELDCKKDFKFLNDYLVEKGYKPAKVWSDIEDLIMKTLISLTPHGTLYYNHAFPKDRRTRRCFHILGFDVLIRQSPDYVLKPYLLEVNNQPSLRMDTPTDYIVKQKLIRDTIQLVGDQVTKGVGRVDHFYGFKPLEFRDEYKIIDIFSAKKLRNIFFRGCGVRRDSTCQSSFGRLEITGTKLLSFFRQTGVLRRNRLRNAKIDILFAEMSRRYSKKRMDFNDFLDVIVEFAKKLYLTKNRSPFSALYKFFRTHFGD